MKRIINTLLILAASVLPFSCSMEVSLDVPANEAIVLDLSTGGTKAVSDLAKPDNPTESYVNHVDVLIFDDNAGTPDALKYYGRYQVNNASQLTLEADRTSFEQGKPYHVYIVANCNLPESDFTTVGTYVDFVDMKQTDELLHLSGLYVSGAPEYFLMDAKTTVVLYNGDPSDNTKIHATLRRAAAKVVINVTAGPDITFSEFNHTVDGKLVSDGGLYYIQNLPYQAFLLAEAREDETINSDVVALRNTARGYDGHFYWHPETDRKKASLVT